MGDAPVTIIGTSETEIVADVNSYDVADTLTLTSGADKTSAQLEVRNWIEPSADKFRAGVVEVLLSPGANVSAIATQLGGNDPEQIFADWDFPELEAWWRFRVEGDTIARVREWSTHPDILWVQPDIIQRMQPAVAPDDPCYPDPTPTSCDAAEFSVFGITYADDGQWGLQRIAAEGAWAIERGDPSVRIAVVDHAVDVGSGELYEEIGSRVVVARDATGMGLQPAGYHGTFVAGVAAARADNGIGVAGVAPDVSIVSYKVLGQCCPDLAEEWFISLLWATALDDVDVVNMSIVSGTTDDPVDLLVQSVITLVSNAGVVLVAAAGNIGQDMDEQNVFVTPAEYNNVIAVAATDDTDGRAYFNALGIESASSNFGSAVDISAPGVDIMSTNWSQGGGGPGDFCAGAKYCSDSGTSFSAPMVSGVAALLASRGFYGCEIVETITGTDQFGDPISADPITWSGGGVGRLNAQKALEWWGGGPIVSDISWPDGAIIHERGSPDRYVINGGVKQIAGGFNERNDQCVPPAVFDAIPTADSDGDGILDDVDNCPSWPNAGQQLPPWTVPAADPDCDSFTSSIEVFVGTDPLDQCADTSVKNDEADDRWPADTNDDQSINVFDTVPFIDALNSVAPGPPYTVRLDLNMDGKITVFDLVPIGPLLNTSCDP